MIVFFDIDGTLVDDETQIIPESAVRAVEELGRRGHLAVVNTGRPLSHLDPRIRAMAFGGFICGCGMEIEIGGKCLRRQRPTRSACRKALEAARACGMQVLYEAQGGVLTDGEFSSCSMIRREVERFRDKGLTTGSIRDLAEPEFIKFVTLDAPGCRRQEMIRRMESDFLCIQRGPLIEYVPLGSTKAGGMKLVMDWLQIDPRDSYAIGDSANDLTMFAAAGHTACMGGGARELQEAADFVTAPVLEDGIEKALRHFGLIG